MNLPESKLQIRARRSGEGASSTAPNPIPKAKPLSEEEKRDLAIRTLSEMRLDDDDVAIVVVASPYRRLDNVSMIIDGSNSKSLREAMEMLRWAIKGTDVERFIETEFVAPEIDRTINRRRMLESESEIRIRQEAFQCGRNDVINHIVSLLKGGEE